MYVVMCLALALVLALYIGLMKKFGERRKQRIKLLEQQLAKVERDKRANDKQ